MDPRRPADRRVRRPRRDRVLRRLRGALHPARDRRPAGRSARTPRDVPRLAGEAGGQRQRGQGHRRPGVPEPVSLLHPLHRGASRLAGRRRDEPAGHRSIPRRRAPRGDGPGEHRLRPVRGRAGDHGAPALHRNAHPRRAARRSPTSSGPIPRRSGTSSRSACASRAPSRAPSVWPCATPGSPASTSRRAPS